MRQVVILAVIGFFVYQAAKAPSSADAVVMLVLGFFVLLIVGAIFGGIDIGGYVADKVEDHHRTRKR